ncbi:hypothetical protein A2U01_0059140, partial [Trifolium medium]|nr:hypothetical protein [Trifolium medium]
METTKVVDPTTTISNLQIKLIGGGIRNETATMVRNKTVAEVGDVVYVGDGGKTEVME